MRQSLLLLTVLIAGLVRLDVIYADDEPFIVIDTVKLTLSVFENNKLQAQFKNISLGRGGAGMVRKKGDARTPLGEFRIAWINRNSRYKLFFGLNYPNLEYATRAYNNRLIGPQDLAAIKTALRGNKTPPQNTDLGGHIGIHGVGHGDIRVHKAFNWTDGCVALTNEQIDQLAKWIAIGTKVIIT